MRINIDKIAELVAALELTPQQYRLEILRQTVFEQGGRWDLPSEQPGVYQPFLMSAQVHGVFAAGSSLDDLPRNWMRAAMNILKAYEEGAA